MTESEKAVQEWRERGPDEEPKPTGRIRLCWTDHEGRKAFSQWSDPEAFGIATVGEKWLEWEFVSRTPGKPA